MEPDGHGHHEEPMTTRDIAAAYDGVLFWVCPNCDGRWQRWEPGTRLYGLAEEYMGA